MFSVLVSPELTNFEVESQLTRPLSLRLQINYACSYSGQQNNKISTQKISHPWDMRNHVVC